jgi:DNA-binding CsgD family transcriptional regulator
MAITGRDLRTLMRIVAPDDAGSTDPLPESVLSGLRELIRCDSIVFTMLDTVQREDVMEQVAGDTTCVVAGDDLNKAFWTLYWDCAACSYPDVSGDLTSVTTLSDFYSDRQLHSATMYCEYLHPRDRKREMMLCLPSQPGRVLRLLFWRGKGPDFSQRDRDLLTLLRPHLHNTYREQRRRETTTTPLTARQHQLLGLVAAGHTNSQIARRLSISEATVRKHLEHIFQRLQVTSRTAAVTRVFGNQHLAFGP